MPISDDHARSAEGEATRKPKNIIVCSDGTSNTKRTNTNVYQFFKKLDGKPGNRCIYDAGVGSFFADISGKAFGMGVGENIRQSYEFLVDHYEPDDRIFLFGFSPRGSRIHASVVDRIRGPFAPTVGDPNARYRPPSLAHKGTQTDATPFRPAWDQPPDFGLTARHEVVDHDYQTT